MVGAAVLYFAYRNKAKTVCLSFYISCITMFFKATPAPIPSSNTNSAFVFIKPHANTKAVQALVSKELQDKGIKILKEGA